MILRFAAESDIDTSYAAWRLQTAIPYSIRAVTKVRATGLHAALGQFLGIPPLVKTNRIEIMKLMSEVRFYHHVAPA